MANELASFLNDKIESISKLSSKQRIGIGGFNLFVPSRQGYAKSSTIPFVPIENGSSIADHVIKNPLVLEIDGTVADITLKETSLEKAYTRAIDVIGNINRYLPDWTKQQILAINEIITDAQNTINEVDDYINSGDQVFDYFTNGSTVKGISERFIDFIDALQDSNKMIKIEFPYRVYENMFIINFQVIRPDTYTDGFDFKLTAMQVQFAETFFADVSEFFENPSQAVVDQTTGEINKGVNKTEDVPVSGLSFLAGLV